MKESKPAKLVTVVCLTAAVILFVSGCNAAQAKAESSSSTPSVSSSRPPTPASPASSDTVPAKASESSSPSSTASRSHASTDTSYTVGVDFLSQNTGFMNFEIAKLANDMSDSLLSDQNYLLKTLDGGSKWSIVNSKANFISTDFVNTQVGYCLKDTTGSANEKTYTLAKTLDGGVNWSNISFEANKIWSVQAISQNVLFVTTGRPAMGQADVGDIMIYRSLDGGRSWAQVKSPPVYHYQAIGLMDWLSSTEGYIMCIENSGAGNISPKTLYYTNNGGAVWSVKSRSGDPADSSVKAVGKISGAGRGIASMYFYSNGTGYFDSVGESVYKTTDGGVNFFGADPLPGFGGYDSSFNMVNSAIGYVYVNDTQTLYDTTNGGAKWNPITTTEKIAAQLKP